MKKAIEIKNLHKYYGKFHALNDVTMNIYEGDIYGLIGKNGAGKTTLFKQILGLSNYQEGHISILNSTDENSLRDSRQNVGFFINSTFFPYLTAKENLEYFRILKGIEDESEVQRVLEIVELANVKKTYKSFSMGMKQRLGIANAIMGNPKIVILDEPINGLDPQGIVDVRNLIQRLNKEFNMTLIVSSHILNELGLIANRFGMIDNGVLLTEITAEELFDLKDALVVKTDTYQALEKLINETEGLEIISGNEINELNIKGVEDSSWFIKYCLKSDIDIKEVYYHKNSLEDFYFSLTEGGIR